jgi:hypothetical protein
MSAEQVVEIGSFVIAFASLIANLPIPKHTIFARIIAFLALNGPKVVTIAKDVAVAVEPPKKEEQPKS